MKKTKFDISTNAYAALVFASGLLGIIPAVILMIAALVFEDDGWLKRMSVKAVAFMVVMKIFSVAIMLFPNLLSLLGNMFVIFEISTSGFEKINILFGTANTALSIMTNVLLIFYAYQTYLGKYARVLFVEGFVNKNM